MGTPKLCRRYPDPPVVDTGSDAAAAGLTTDQRELLRFSGDHVDIGAVELQLIAANHPFQITGITRLGNGASQFGFTNLGGRASEFLRPRTQACRRATGR